MTRSQVAFGPSYILLALVRGPSQTHVRARTVARTCGKGCTYLRGRLHVLAGKDARTCVEGRYVLPDFALNACPLCLKRMPSLPQTLSSAPANVIIRSCKRYHPLLQTLSSVPANVIIRSCKRYHPLLQTFASDSGFFFRVTMRDMVFLSLRGFRP